MPARHPVTPSLIHICPDLWQTVRPSTARASLRHEVRLWAGLATARVFDVIVVGGGLAGSALAGALACAGLDVLVVEREARFRDRIRGEFTWPWGVVDALQLGLDEVLRRAGRVELEAVEFYEDRQLVKTDPFEGTPMIGFLHPALQEELFTWAGSGGVTTLRPAKATRFAGNGGPTVTVAVDG